ncbi:MAG: nicotinate-nucleotide adenylyltransferase [Actinomycetota bacterium]
MSGPPIGIMGGTFDPIHHGHLVTAAEAISQFGLDRVLFVPCGRPWQKSGSPVSPAEDRYVMTVLATVDHPHFEVSRVEIDRPGPTYAVDTLRRLREEMAGSPLYFITGADAVLSILTWKDPHELLDLCEIIAATRPGHDLSRLREIAPSAAGRVRVMQIPALAISSTDIRERVAKGLPIDYLVPPQVASYIAKRGLYRDAAGS